MADLYEQQAKIFKAFCDERRLRILELLRGGETCACKLCDAMDMPQSSLSYHMKILCESGIVLGREEGKWTHYCISPEGSRKVMELLREITQLQETEESPCRCQKT